MRQGFDFSKQEDIKKLNGKTYAYCYLISDLPIKNISKDNVIINALYVDDKTYKFDGDVLVESGKSIWIKM